MGGFHGFYHGRRADLRVGLQAKRASASNKTIDIRGKSKSGGAKFSFFFWELLGEVSDFITELGYTLYLYSTALIGKVCAWGGGKLYYDPPPLFKGLGAWPPCSDITVRSQ